MPIEDGDYVQRTREDILTALEAELQAEFGEDIDLTESSVFSTYAGALSTVLSENQESSLDRVYDAAYLETADGDDLDNVVSIVGIKRRAATEATGVEKFSVNSVPSSKETVPSSTRVKTGGDDPVAFETQEAGSIQFLDGAEDGDLNEYDGDITEFSTSSAQASEGSNSIQAAQTSGTVIYNTNHLIEQGKTLSFDVRLNSGSVAHQYPMVEDGSESTLNGVRAVLDESSGSHKVEVVESGSVVSDTSESVSLPSGEWLTNEIEVNTQNEIVSTVYDSNDDELSSITLDEGDTATFEEGHYGVGSGDATTNKYWDNIASIAVEVNILCQEGGRRGNNAANTVTNAANPPSGFDNWTNPYPTGDNTFFDTDNETFVVGRNRETDEELRARTRQTYTAGGSATVDALLSALVNDIDDVISATILENDTGSSAVPPNGTNSLPEYSFEAVVYGGADQDVAEAIFDTKAVTARDVGGYHGSNVTKSVVSDVNDDSYDVNFTRPTEINLYITVDIVVDGTYVGDDDIKDEIVNYIGGTDTDGNKVLGTDVGEDVFVDTVEDEIVGSENGVVGVEVDGNGKSQIDIDDSGGSSLVTTNSNNLEVVSIGGTDVAVVDATNITVNTTTQ